MSTFDLVLRNGSVVLDGAVIRADVGIRDGMIVELATGIGGTTDEERDCTAMHLLPGMIDAHVHFNEPGRTDWEGWATGSLALAAGGGTVAIDMPLNSDPPVLTATEVELKRAAAESSSIVDFALWGGLTPINREALSGLADAGVIGFKAFMSNSGIAEFPAADDATLLIGMEIAAERGLVVAVHAENDAITAELAARAVGAGKTSWADWVATRPVHAETEAIARAIRIAEGTGCKLHIVHVSSVEGVAEVVAGRARGVDVTCETCPHYLTFTADDLPTLCAHGKCAPPLRSEANRLGLWDALASGQIQTVGSDHSPAPPSMKSGGEPFAAWGGISGCQSSLPALLSEGYHHGRLDLPTVARASASTVAERFRLGPRGRIAPGHIADIALVDLERSFTLRAEDLRYRHHHSAYVGRDFRGSVVATYAGGELIWHDGQSAVHRRGHMIRPT